MRIAWRKLEEALINIIHQLGEWRRRKKKSRGRYIRKCRVLLWRILFQMETDKNFATCKLKWLKWNNGRLKWNRDTEMRLSLSGKLSSNSSNSQEEILHLLLILKLKIRISEVQPSLIKFQVSIINKPLTLLNKLKTMSLFRPSVITVSYAGSTFSNLMKKGYKPKCFSKRVKRKIL